LHFSLVLVGAHDGSGMEGLVKQSSETGRVLLVEPVPFLFRRLESRFAGLDQITFRNIAIARTDGEVDFFAPKETAKSVVSWAEEMGSLVPGYAVAVEPRLAEHIEVIKAQALCFETLLKTEQITSIDMLFTDMEGMDTELLQTFPFGSVVPKRIVFEFKHAAGVFQTGPKLAGFLSFLEERGYRFHLLDHENIMAQHTSLAS
jgi:FkbM family methyltransferase